MKKIELQKLIREEVKGALSEVNDLDEKVADLYGYAGVKTQYSDFVTKRYDKKTIDLAIQMAPKIIAYQTSLKKIAKQMENSTEAKILLAAMNSATEYGGGYGKATLGDLLDRYTK
jgi:hypothetical protein